MPRIIVGIVLVLLGVAFGLVGQSLLGADLHPVTTGLIAVGLVVIGVGVTERRFETRGSDDRVAHRDVHSSERVR